MKTIRRCLAVLILVVCLSTAGQAGITIPGRIAITSAGTPAQLYNGTVSQAYVVIIQARTANAGTVFIGNNAMNKTTGAGVSVELAAGQSITYQGGVAGINPQQLFIDGTNGDAVNMTIIF